MRYRRADVVEQALQVLDTWGLADLTMRRLGSELGIQPSALYHHFANKQLLLAAVADEILSRGLSAEPGPMTGWAASVRRAASELRDALLAYRDGAEVVATTLAFGLGGEAAVEHLMRSLSKTGLDATSRAVAASTLLYYVLGHVGDEQTELQANSVGAIDRAPREAAAFVDGLDLIIDGISSRVGLQVVDA